MTPTAIIGVLLAIAGILQWDRERLKEAARRKEIEILQAQIDKLKEAEQARVNIFSLEQMENAQAQLAAIEHYAETVLALAGSGRDYLSKAHTPPKKGTRTVS